MMGSGAPMLEEQPGWMGFRSSIDGFNVHQHPSTGPGGAQDHQDPVAYSNGKWPTGTGATMSRPTNVMGAGGSIYQAPGRDQSGGRFSGSNGHSGNWQRVVAPRQPRLSGPFVQLAGADPVCICCVRSRPCAVLGARWQCRTSSMHQWPTHACLALAGAGTYPYDSPASFDADPKHGFGGYGGGANAGALNVGEAANPGGSYYCADCTW